MVLVLLGRYHWIWYFCNFIHSVFTSTLLFILIFFIFFNFFIFFFFFYFFFYFLVIKLFFLHHYLFSFSWLLSPRSSFSMPSVPFSSTAFFLSPTLFLILHKPFTSCHHSFAFLLGILLCIFPQNYWMTCQLSAWPVVPPRPQGFSVLTQCFYDLTLLPA